MAITLNLLFTQFDCTLVVIRLTVVLFVEDLSVLARVLAAALISQHREAFEVQFVWLEKVLLDFGVFQVGDF